MLAANGLGWFIDGLPHRSHERRYQIVGAKPKTGIVEREPHTDKDTLRTAMRSFRASLPSERHAFLSDRICFHLQKSEVFEGARSIHAFWPMIDRGEVDIRPVIHHARQSGCTVWLPVVVGTALRHRPFEDDSRLSPGAFGQLEPVEGPEREHVEPDLIIVPGLAVDAKGNRLGYGGGFYDRFLARAHGSKDRPTLVMPVFQRQVVENVPAEPHDIPVDAFVTEAGLRWCNERRLSV